MKVAQLITVSTLALCCVAISAQQSNELKSSATGGAVPEPTQAEKALVGEQDFHTRLTNLSTAIDSIAQNIVSLRRSIVPKSESELQRLDRELTLAEKEAADLSLVGVSPLAQLQREEQQDRLLDLRAMLESLQMRWKSSVPVFGLKTFQSLPSNAVSRKVARNYRLRIGDKLNILVASKLGSEKSYDVVVDRSGFVSLVGAGKVTAVGKTADILESDLQKKISRRFNQLRVSVSVESYAVLQVQVLGEVARSGTYNLGSSATLSEALRFAGGPTETGSLRHVTLSREGGIRKTIDLYGLLLYGKGGIDLPLHDGDVVFVPAVGSTISLLGEVTRPGRYEILNPITLGDALKMAGGAKPTGYLQSVQVDRVEDGEFRELVNYKVGVKESNAFPVKPGDEISIYPVHSDRANRISISGPVKSPGVYGYKEGMRVKDLIEAAQGFLPEEEVYGGRADILRYDPMQGARIITVNLTKVLTGETSQNIALQKFDRLFVYNPDQIVFRPKVVTVSGALARPGVYKRTNGMRVSDAVAAAGGALPEAYLTRANLIRHLDGDKTEIVAVDLVQALSGNPEVNVELKDRDEITIFTQSEAQWQEHSVKVEGAVQRPGVYQRSENMRVSDVLFLTGGILPEAATQCQIARMNKDGSTNIITIELASLKPKGTFDEVIMDRDVVTIPRINGSERGASIVYVTGEVARPGPYAINPRIDRISDIVNRAGGLTSLAYTNGALFLRLKENFQNDVQDREADILLQKSRLLSDKQFAMQLAKMGINFNPSTNPVSTDIVKPVDVNPTVIDTEKKNDSKKGTTDIDNTVEKKKESAMGAPVKIDVQPNLNQQKTVLEDTIRVSVDLNSALTKTNSSDNLLLVSGDRLFIPVQSNIVTIVGAVLHPHRVAARDKAFVKDYIAKSGGYSQDAAARYTVVIRANGDAYPADKVKYVMPGDMIVVPTTGLIDVTKKIEKVRDVTQVIADVLSSVFILTRL
jgi:protein involved in polysaccharide export with SLBB domain